MSITKDNKIEASDISTALNNKQDKLNYTPVKSVNGTVADTAGNVDVSTSMTTRKVFTSSTTFTTPKAGVYTFILVGGGQGGYNASSNGNGGDGGNGGKYFEMSLYLNANTSCSITVGAGGSRGGKAGGQSKVTANNITYTSGAGTTISLGGTPGADDNASITTNGGDSAFGGTGGAKKTLSPGGGGGVLLNGITAPTAGSATSGYKGDNGTGGYGFGAGGAGGGDPYGGGNYGYGGAGAAGVVVIYY